MDVPTSEIVHGDALDVLAELPAESVHAIVTDPPYGLAFMGRDWDTFDPKEYQEWCEEWAALALDVLKPGGHLLAFSGNRTHHRLFSGVEDAGFEVRDTITWHYGSGFPKALDVSKALDKAAGAEREKVPASGGLHNYDQMNDDGWRKINEDNPTMDSGKPATEAAREWDGWKTALKPATEFVVLARKPFEGTVAENVVDHGTGALNIDGCRIEAGDGGWTREGPIHDIRGGNYASVESHGKRIGDEDDVRTSHEEGRYPANVVFDEAAAEALDRQVGEKPTGKGSGPSFGGGDDDTHEGWTFPAHESYKKNEGATYGDTGGPSRYFYTSKASRSERTLGGQIDNAHPTVKPVDLMEWLVRLVTARDQIVLDPFAGTGTTCLAAKNLGRRFVGIEKQAQWADVARVRCGLDPSDPTVARPDPAQTGVEQF